MQSALSFIRYHRTKVMVSFMVAMFAVMSVMPAAAQEGDPTLDTGEFTDAILEGMQIFFDNLPAFILVGFAVFGIIFAFIFGLRFAKYLLGELTNALGRG